FQSPDKQKIGFLFWLMSRSERQRSPIPRARNKMRYMYNSCIQSHSVVDLFAKAARSNKCINMLDCGLHHARLPPPLGRTLVYKSAGEAIPLCAGGAIESKEHMSRTNQPVLMHRVELNTGAVFQDLWSTDQRNIMIVDDVKTFV